jgi:hypothetical protein
MIGMGRVTIGLLLMFIAFLGDGFTFAQWSVVIMTGLLFLFSGLHSLDANNKE